MYDAGHNELISRWTGLQMKFTQEKKKEQEGLDSIIKIRSMCYTHDGKLLCLGGMDGTLSIFDLNPYKEHGEIHNVLISKRRHTKRITAIACNPNSTPEKTTLITCSDDEQIVKWTFTASGEDNYELTGNAILSPVSTRSKATRMRGSRSSPRTKNVLTHTARFTHRRAKPQASSFKRTRKETERLRKTEIE